MFNTQTELAASLVIILLAVCSFSSFAQPYLPVPYEAPIDQQQEYLPPMGGDEDDDESDDRMERTGPGPTATALPPQTAAPASPLATAKSRPVGASGTAEGGIRSISADSAGNVFVYLDTQSNVPFVLALQADDDDDGTATAAYKAIFELLLYAFENDRAVSISYSSNNELVRVEIRR